MTWYLTIRALAILSFVVAFLLLFVGASFLDDHRHRQGHRAFLASLVIAVLGCLLVGVGWS